MTAVRPLAGSAVLTIGMRWDAVGRGVRALAGAGADVLVYPEGPGWMFGGDEEIVTDVDRELLALSLPVDSGTVTVVPKLGEDQVSDALTEWRVGELWDDALARLGHIDVVYLSGWYGFTAFEVGREVLQRLQAQGGGQLIVTERPHEADQRVRWYDRWQRELARDVDVVVLTEPFDDPGQVGLARRDLRDGWEERPVQGAAQVLLAEGWGGPLTVADADRWARHRREEGQDVLAGQLWRDVGVEHVDSGRIVVGDGTVALSDDLRAVLRGPEPSPAFPERSDPPFVRFSTGGDWPVGVEVAPADGQVIAVRLELEDEGFDSRVRYAWRGWLDLPAPGLLALSDPAYLAEGEPRRIEVRPGRWEVEDAVRESRTIGLRLRHTNPYDPDPFAGTEGVDRERATYVVADGLDGAVGGTIQSCLVDRSGRTAVLHLASGEVYELVFAFDPSPVEGVVEAPAVLDEMVAALAVAAREQRKQFDADEDEEAPSIDGAVRNDERTIAVSLIDGPTITVGLRPLTAPVPLHIPEAYRKPSELHGHLSSCAACGATMWPIGSGYPTHESFLSQGQDQRHIGGCTIDLDQPSSTCTTCGWAPRPLWATG